MLLQAKLDKVTAEVFLTLPKTVQNLVLTGQKETVMIIANAPRPRTC